MINNSALVLHDLSFSYSDTPVFKHINESFQAGQMTILMSPSGSGKSTLLSLIAGILPIQGGSIEYPVSAPLFSMAFQENRLLENQSILKNLWLTNPSLTYDEILSALQAANLSYSPDKRVSKLSGGEKRRVAILRALLSPYDILLMDEPFTGLDEDNKLIMMNLVKEMSAGKTSLVVTHNKSEADCLGCRISNCLS